MRRLSSCFLLALVATLAGALSCSPTAVRPHAPLTAAAEPLRSDFNRDAGRVRIVMIPAPT
ncbi:MAG TPA: hypothetical protein VE379_09530 [Vicinamibacterales bacterium]|jgi:hypothetical protein|nr:hypothetical protein [Vicinamibacterales bacterium]